MDELNLKLIRVVSIIFLSEVVGSIFFALCLLLVQLKICFEYKNHSCMVKFSFLSIFEYFLVTYGE